MRGVYRFAGHIFEVNSVYQYVHLMCRDYVSEEKPEFAINTSREELRQEQSTTGAPYLEAVIVYRKLAECLLKQDVLLMHGSVVAVDGEAYLFTAKSGTGKSTHTRLWREYFGERAVMINDDKPLVEIEDNQLVVYGTPWNGKHHLGENTSCRLKAICILTRGEANSIEQITFAEAYSMLVQQIHKPFDDDAMLKTLDLIDKLKGKVRFYRLACNMEPDAARISYEGMQ